MGMVADPNHEFKLNERAHEIRWSKKFCGQSGCLDPDCVCALCAQPIGIAEDDPRWERHDEDCIDCDLCRDEVPIILFKGKGKKTLQAAFHEVCFKKLLRT